jgi:hypothetical protein
MILYVKLIVIAMCALGSWYSIQVIIHKEMTKVMYPYTYKLQRQRIIRVVGTWKVNVNFKLFVYDQIHKNYLTIQGIYILLTYIKICYPIKLSHYPKKLIY